MTDENSKELVCPNCFGTASHEVLATATSRNIVEDDSAPLPGSADGVSLDGNRRRDYVKRFCIHCGHELSGNGGRA